jgi:hypothetical protein
MKNTYLHFSNIAGLSLFLIVLLLCRTADARVSSMTFEKQIDINGKSYSSITVKCSGRQGRPNLLKQAGKSNWCDSQLIDTCHRNKLKAAEYACSSNRIGTIRSIANGQENLAAQQASEVKKNSINKLLLEQAQIEEKLIAIKQARQMLNRKEMNVIQQRQQLYAAGD